MEKNYEFIEMEGSNMESYKIRIDYKAMRNMNKTRLRKYLRSLRNDYYADKDISSEKEVKKLEKAIAYGFNILNNG